MKVVIAGGTGLLGRALTGALAGEGHGVVVLTRHPGTQPGLGGARHVGWSADGTAGEWARELADAEAVVNLSGAGIADRRWTTARKEALRSSRVLSTRSLVTAIRSLSTRPAVFVQQGGEGYSGADAGTRELDESFPPGDDFMGQLAVAWEAEALPAAALGCRLAVLRTGMVLTPHEGALARMIPPFRWFVGGPIASGRQYLSWIHVDDWIRMVRWVLTEPAVSGVLNATAPHPVTNAEFSRALARAVRRPSWAPVPAFVLRLLFGEMADAVLVRGQRVVPRRALESGFAFAHPEVGEALMDAVHRGA
jgi:uncharacterized protein (TIGR01777 family)